MFGFQTFGRRMMQVATKSIPITNKYSFSRSLSWSNMYLWDYIRETSSLLTRTTPVPSLALMNIMNLRELIEKCSEEAELEPNSSIVLSDIVVKGNSNHWEQFCSSLVPIIPDIVGISMCALMKNMTTILTRLDQPILKLEPWYDVE